MKANPASYLKNGFANEAVGRYTSSGNAQNQARPVGLKLVQLIYHSGKLSTKASGLMDISPNTKCLRMAPEELERLGLTEGGCVRVTSDHGQLELGVEADLAVLPGTCVFPEHFTDPPIKDLIPVELDPVTRVPYFKLAQVSIDKV